MNEDRATQMIWMLVVIAVSGAFGGLATGIGSGRTNEILFPGRNTAVRLGFLGDMLVGSAASLAIHFVAPLFEGQRDPGYSDTDYIRAVSLGIIAGFAGIKLLFSLAEIPQKMINASKNQVLTHMHDQDRSRELIRQVEEMLKEIDRTKLQDPSTAWADAARAEEAIRRVLDLVPQDPRALVVKAKVLRRKAELDVDGDAARWWQQAIQVLSDAVGIDPSYDRLFYNRACYQALRGKHHEALKDLAEAIQLFAPNAQFAREDPDFVALHRSAEFERLVNGSLRADVPSPSGVGRS